MLKFKSLKAVVDFVKTAKRKFDCGKCTCNFDSNQKCN